MLLIDRHGQNHKGKKTWIMEVDCGCISNSPLEKQNQQSVGVGRERESERERVRERDLF